MSQTKPPIHCTPCRVIINGERFRLFADGSVCISMPVDQIKQTNATLGDIRAYEEQEIKTGLGLYPPSSVLSKMVRKEASRLRRNRNARERNLQSDCQR